MRAPPRLRRQALRARDGIGRPDRSRHRNAAQGIPRHCLGAEYDADRALSGADRGVPDAEHPRCRRCRPDMCRDLRRNGSRAQGRRCVQGGHCRAQGRSRSQSTGISGRGTHGRRGRVRRGRGRSGSSHRSEAGRCGRRDRGKAGHYRRCNREKRRQAPRRRNAVAEKAGAFRHEGHGL